MTDTLPINEMFETLQGEASHTGMPSVFIRLQGCDVGCPWCDTRHTWDLDVDEETSDPARVLVLKGESSPLWANVTIADILALMPKFHSRHVVLTGGEPCTYDLRPLSTALIDDGRTVQVETSGTYQIHIDPRAFVTLSPKIDMPGGRQVRADALARANEIKMPIGKQDDIVKLLHLLDRHDHAPGTPIWLQPISRNHKATLICQQNAIANAHHGFRVSMQVHALAGWR